MAGTERLYLYQPPNAPKTNLLGEQYDRLTRTINAGEQPAFPGEKVTTRWTIRAYRQDRGGREALIGDARIGEWGTRFEIRMTPGISYIDERWWIEDHWGREYDIEAVDEKSGTQGRYLWLYAKRRTVKKTEIRFGGEGAAAFDGTARRGATPDRGRADVGGMAKLTVESDG